MQKARRHPKGLRPLVSVWFQDLFHSLIQGTFHLSLTVLVHYRSSRSIQPYQMVLVDSHRISRAPWYSGYCYNNNAYVYKAITLFRSTFQLDSTLHYFSILQSYNPANAGTLTVWAGSRSLAATNEIIIIFSSSGYLDVSVLRVCSLSSDYSSKQPGCPIQKSTGQRIQHLTVAYRSLSRLSSPLEAQASAIRS